MSIEKISPLEKYAKAVLSGKEVDKAMKSVQDEFDKLPKCKQDELFLSAKYGDSKTLISKLLTKFKK